MKSIAKHVSVTRVALFAAVAAFGLTTSQPTKAASDIAPSAATAKGGAEVMTDVSSQRRRYARRYRGNGNGGAAAAAAFAGIAGAAIIASQANRGYYNDGYYGGGRRYYGGGPRYYGGGPDYYGRGGYGYGY